MDQSSIPFGFLFHFHKSAISIGVSDTDAVQLAAVYGTTSEFIKEALEQLQRDLDASASRLLQKVDLESVDDLCPTRIAFLGDSNTSYRKSYLNIIRAALYGKKHIELLDFSVSGYKSDNLLYALYPGIQDAHPHIAHIMIGTNDMRRLNDGSDLQIVPPEVFRRNLNHLIEVLQGNDTKVVLSTLPVFSSGKITISGNLQRSLYCEEDRKVFNDIIRTAAETNGAVLNDMDNVFSAFQPEELTLDDGLHLNTLGHELLSLRVWNSLLEVTRLRNNMD